MVVSALFNFHLARFAVSAAYNFQVDSLSVSALFSFHFARFTVSAEYSFHVDSFNVSEELSLLDDKLAITK